MVHEALGIGQKGVPRRETSGRRLDRVCVYGKDRGDKEDKEESTNMAEHTVSMGRDTRQEAVSEASLGHSWSSANPATIQYTGCSFKFISRMCLCVCVCACC